MNFFSFSYEQLQQLRLKDFFFRFYKKAFEEEDVTSNSAQVAFYFAFALFPLLLFLVSLFGIVIESAGDLRAEMFYYLRQVMPTSAYDLVQKTIEEVTESSSGGKLTFGIVTALWAASAGIDSIRVVLNGVYNLTETRAWWKTKLTSLSLTLGLGILVTLALGIVFYGSKFLMLILNTLNLPIQSPVILGVLQWIIVLIVLVSIFALLYNFLPNHKNYKWVWVTPGTIISIILWLLVSYGFRLYLGYFNSYAKTYGSLGAVIILMLWLYLTAFVILIGGAINAVLEEFTDPETAEAGANKAAAKAIIENPDGSLTDKTAIQSDKKAEVLATLNQTVSENNPKVAETAPTDAGEKNIEPKKQSVSKKSSLKLAVGLVVGLVENLFSSRNKR